MPTDTNIVKPSVSAKHLTLTPVLHPLITRFLDDQKKLHELVQALGSPLNILFPQVIHENVEAFRSAFSRQGIEGRVYFAHKANQSDCLLRQLAIEKVYVDVSSINELRHALSSGFEGSRLEATGPKHPDFLSLAILHGVTISIDSISELLKVMEIRKLLKISSLTNVLIRLSGFEAEHSRFLNKASRFGIPLKELDEAFSILEESRDHIVFLGFAFHLDTVSVLERAVAIENCIELFESALSRGLEPKVLNIGGGYKINYLKDENDWNVYTSALKESVLGTRESLTWQGNGFGLSPDKGKLRGNFNSYNYFDQQTGGKFLDELLNQQFLNLGDMTAGALLRDNMIELWIEPGRSLVDQTGITLARVNSVRNSSRGETIVCLNMKRQDISFLDQEIFVDPVVITSKPKEGTGGISYPVYFAGNLCLESDLVYRHQTFLTELPEPGDIVAFINTAGYFMDFSATNSIMQPIARKVAVFEGNEGFNWVMDDQYSVIWNLLT